MFSDALPSSFVAAVTITVNGSIAICYQLHNLSDIRDKWNVIAPLNCATSAARCKSVARPDAAIKTGRVAQPITDAIWCDRSWICNAPLIWRRIEMILLSLETKQIDWKTKRECIRRWPECQGHRTVDTKRWRCLAPILESTPCSGLPSWSSAA